MSHDAMLVRGMLVRHSTLRRDWVCRCGSTLVLKFRDDWVTECQANREHDADSWFITKATDAREQAKLNEYQYWYTKGENRMGFVKDRHGEDGRITGKFRVRRVGRISLGEQKPGGGAKALDYFTFKVYDEGLTGQHILSDVQQAIEEYAPGQEAGEPKILPVFLPADSLDLFASSTYKLAGKEGHPRCVGDGETIQFKLGDRNMLEVSNGQVVTRNMTLDGEPFPEGHPIGCPGRSQENRWSHCEKCRLVLNIDLHLAGLPYIWSLSTGDQTFYDQFFTTLEMCAYYIKEGAARFLPDIPLLLRREEGMKARPTVRDGDTFLTWQEMPLLSIEVHPIWKMQADNKVKLVLDAPTAVAQIAPPKPWHERVKSSLSDRPWTPDDVMDFATLGTEEFYEDDDGASEAATKTSIKMVTDVVAKVFAKTMEPAQVEEATSLVFWFLFGGKLETNAQCAVVWRWARDDRDKGTVPNPNFEQELLGLLDWANKVATEQENDEQPEGDGEGLPF